MGVCAGSGGGIRFRLLNHPRSLTPFSLSDGPGTVQSPQQFRVPGIIPRVRASLLGGRTHAWGGPGKGLLVLLGGRAHVWGGREGRHLSAPHHCPSPHCCPCRYKRSSNTSTASTRRLHQISASGNCGPAQYQKVSLTPLLEPPPPPVFPRAPPARPHASPGFPCSDPRFFRSTPCFPCSTPCFPTRPRACLAPSSPVSWPSASLKCVDPHFWVPKTYT